MRDRKSDAHRRIAQSQSAVPLTPDTVVHHKNEDKSDNSPGNLETKSRARHTADHNRARPLSRLRKSLRLDDSSGRIY